jgi:hypothetical protein
MSEARIISYVHFSLISLIYMAICFSSEHPGAILNCSGLLQNAVYLFLKTRDAAYLIRAHFNGQQSDI